MDQPTRVWKMLVCLVTAMTGTAAFLGWLDPTRPSTSDALPYDEIIRLARSAVVEDVVIRQDQWQEVEIGADAVAAAGPLLRATAGGDDSHFRVGRDGRPVQAARWRDQRAPGASPRTIRIQVTPLGEGQPMSPAQWLCVRALVTALNQTIASEGCILPVRLGEGWVNAYGVKHGSVLDLAVLDTTPG